MVRALIVAAFGLGAAVLGVLAVIVDHRWFVIAVPVALLAGLGASSAAVAKQPITASDVLKIRRITDVRVAANGRQVAVLCPTTILAEQHASTFQKRCEPFGLSVEMLSRYRTGGERREIEAEGILSTCLQHEIDHLNGKLFIDYLGPLKRQMITRKMEKLKRELARE